MFNISLKKEEAPVSTHDADAGARERLQAVLLVLTGGQGASESRESLRFKGVSVASTRRARVNLATTRLPDRRLPSGNDTAYPLLMPNKG